MMGDIVATRDEQLQLEVEVAAHAPIERVEIRNGTEVLRTLRPYTAQDLGPRIRVIWSGAEYRGRGRQSQWIGRARFSGCNVTGITKINAWNHERLLALRGSDTVEWDAITTGNFGGFDAFLDESRDERLDVNTNHGQLDLPLADIGIDDVVLDAGGLERRLRVLRLPLMNTQKRLFETVPVELHEQGDNPLWVCVTTEDGFQAWSSPIFVFRD
jgi:hypothetical protein